MIDVGSRVRVRLNPDDPSTAGRLHYTGQEALVMLVAPGDPGENVSVRVRLDSGQEAWFLISELVDID